jgi:hypothetical protein
MSWGDTFNRHKATGMDPSAAAFIADQSEPARKRKLEEKTMVVPQVEPYGYAFQHEETGLQQVVDVQQIEWGFEKNNPRWQKLGPVYLHPPQTNLRGDGEAAIIECLAAGEALIYSRRALNFNLRGMRYAYDH